LDSQIWSVQEASQLEVRCSNRLDLADLEQDSMQPMQQKKVIQSYASQGQLTHLPMVKSSQELSSPETGASWKPHSRLPSAMPTAPMMRPLKPMLTAAETALLEYRSAMSVRTPTEVRALLAP